MLVVLWNLIIFICLVHNMLNEIHEDSVVYLYESLMMITDPEIQDIAMNIIKTIGR